MEIKKLHCLVQQEANKGPGRQMTQFWPTCGHMLAHGPSHLPDSTFPPPPPHPPRPRLLPEESSQPEPDPLACRGPGSGSPGQDWGRLAAPPTPYSCPWGAPPLLAGHPEQPVSPGRAVDWAPIDHPNTPTSTLIFSQTSSPNFPNIGLDLAKGICII